MSSTGHLLVVGGGTGSNPVGAALHAGSLLVLLRADTTTQTLDQNHLSTRNCCRYGDISSVFGDSPSPRRAG